MNVRRVQAGFAPSKTARWPVASPRPWRVDLDALTRPLPGKLDQVARLAVRVLDAEDRPERHALEGKRHLDVRRERPEGRLRVIDDPVEFELAAAAQRLVG